MEKCNQCLSLSIHGCHVHVCVCLIWQIRYHQRPPWLHLWSAIEVGSRGHFSSVHFHTYRFQLTCLAIDPAPYLECYDRIVPARWGGDVCICDNRSACHLLPCGVTYTGIPHIPGVYIEWASILTDIRLVPLGNTVYHKIILALHDLCIT